MAAGVEEALADFKKYKALMNRDIPQLPGVPFSAKAKIGKTWGDV